MSDDIPIWAALADSKRRQIINLLEEKPRTTSELSEYFDVSRFAVMKHLKVLEQANLIKIEREGRKRWNFLNADLVHFLRTKLADDDGPYRLVDILGLFPGQIPTASTASLPADPIEIEICLLLQASPSQVFEALTIGIDAWWGQRASASSQVHLEPYVNGRFYEAFDAAGKGILYATITSIKQDEGIRLRGTSELTELIARSVAPDNFVQVTLEPQDNATLFSLSHRIVGVDKTTRDVCDHRWFTLLNQHLKPFVENGILHQDNP